MFLRNRKQTAEYGTATVETRFSYDGKNDGPPADDVCPICFDDFIIPAKTSCGHWYCADCILQLWSYRGGIQICKCPKCNWGISKLMVEASLFDQRDNEVVKVMERVAHYNGLYLGERPGRPPLPMSREYERRLVLSLIKGYFLITVTLSLIVVFLSRLHLFVALPHETEEIVLEWLWWSNLVNKILFKCFPSFVTTVRMILRIANDR